MSEVQRHETGRGRGEAACDDRTGIAAGMVENKAGSRGPVYSRIACEAAARSVSMKTHDLSVVCSNVSATLP